MVPDGEIVKVLWTDGLAYRAEVTGHWMETYSQVLFTICSSYQRVNDHLQISLLILSKFKRINQLLFPMKSLEGHTYFFKVCHLPMISGGIGVD